jgi:hypothetical protein
MVQMQEAVAELDPKKVKAIIRKVREVGQMLAPEANAMTAVAINAANEACKQIVKAGEQVAIEIDQGLIDTIGTARNSFLDFTFDDDVEIDAMPTPARALDLTERSYGDIRYDAPMREMDVDMEAS